MNVACATFSQHSVNIQDVFSQPPLIAYRKGKNLSQILTSKRLKPNNINEIHPAANLSHLPLKNSDIPAPSETRCKICDRTFRNNKNLKIHYTHKHRNRPSAVSFFWFGEGEDFLGDCWELGFRCRGIFTCENPWRKTWEASGHTTGAVQAPDWVFGYTGGP